eukprot:4747009-Lingulodinium_polyedra.AAC.1
MLECLDVLQVDVGNVSPGLAERQARVLAEDGVPLAAILLFGCPSWCVVHREPSMLMQLPEA